LEKCKDDLSERSAATPGHVSRLERHAIVEPSIMHIGFRELAFTTACQRSFASNRQERPGRQ
jgi:hypothetical protein